MKLNIKKLQQGGTVYKPSPTNKKLNINKDLEVNELPKVNAIKYLTKPKSVFNFKESNDNFLNLPKTKPLNFLNILNSGNKGYDPKILSQMIDRFEGFEEFPYKNKKDPNDRLTIGHGLTDPKYVKLGKITKEDSLKGVQEHIDKEVLPHLTSKPYWNKLNINQKTALVGYVYNIGSGNFNTKSPSLQKALNEGNWREAAKQIDFDYTDPNNPGAKTRRDFERNLFLNN